MIDNVVVIVMEREADDELESPQKLFLFVVNPPLDLFSWQQASVLLCKANMYGSETLLAV